MEEEIRKIWNLKLNETLNLIHAEFFREIKIDHSNSGYKWVAYGKDSRMPTFPMRNANTVAFYKDMKGAKRNFLKRYYPTDLVRKITQNSPLENFASNEGS